MFNFPAITIVISTWNRKKFLNKILFSLMRQNFSRKFEIIVCDSNSTDGTKELILNFMHFQKFSIQYVNLENNISIKRNYGLINAKSNNIVFIDDDCLPEKNFLNKFYNLLARSKPEFVHCGIVKFPKYKLLQKYFRYRQSRHFTKIDNKNLDENKIVTMNMGIKRNLIAKKQILFNKNLGILGKNLNGFEDYEFAYRLLMQGIKIIKCNCTIIHLDDRNLQDHAKKFLIFGRYTIHNLEKINFQACKNNFYYKLKNNFLISFLIKKLYIINIMMFISKIIIKLNQKSYNLSYFYYKFVLLSYYLYGLSLKINAKQ
jgi:glycosyltransferase involved in cell wall biosynthesis